MSKKPHNVTINIPVFGDGDECISIQEQRDKPKASLLRLRVDYSDFVAGLSNTHYDSEKCSEREHDDLSAQLEQATKERDEALALLKSCQAYVKDVPVLRVGVKEALAKLNQ